MCRIVYDFEVYTGKRTVVNERGLGVGGEVVVRLLRDIPNGLNYRCLFDNWFLSPELFAELKQMGIMAVGTIGRNCLRGCVFKTDKELAKAGRGSYEVKYDDVTGLTIVKWYDIKVVFLTSSYLGEDPGEKCRSWTKRGKKYVEVDIPHIVKVYNKTWVARLVRHGNGSLPDCHSTSALVLTHYLLPDGSISE